jgi:hypothetical protein
MSAPVRLCAGFAALWRCLEIRLIGARDRHPIIVEKTVAVLRANLFEDLAFGPRFQSRVGCAVILDETFGIDRDSGDNRLVTFEMADRFPVPGQGFEDCGT